MCAGSVCFYQTAHGIPYPPPLHPLTGVSARFCINQNQQQIELTILRVRGGGGGSVGQAGWCREGGPGVCVWNFHNKRATHFVIAIALVPVVVVAGIKLTNYLALFLFLLSLSLFLFLLPLFLFLLLLSIFLLFFSICLLPFPSPSLSLGYMRRFSI